MHKQKDFNVSTQKKNSKPGLVKKVIVLGLGVVVIAFIFGALFSASSTRRNECTKLLSSGKTTVATVETLELFHQLRRSTEPVSDPNKADGIRLGFQYGVDGGLQTGKIRQSFEQHPSLLSAFKDAQDGSIEIRYLPDSPSTVSLESSFIHGTIDLCRSSSSLRD